MQERLQKILASAGIASRRASERLIEAGRVRVNGRIVKELGAKADPRRDRVEVDGKRIVVEPPAYYVVHKPRGVVATLSDPEGRPTVKELVATIPERVFPIGRLDYHTSGALLFTNDGDLAETLLRPARGIPKTYLAKVKGHLDVPELDRLRNGVTLDDGYKTKPAELFVLREDAGNTWVQITLVEGKNRQIHRMLEAIRRRVQRLHRLAFAEVDIEGLMPGEHRELTAKEVERLKKAAGTPPKPRAITRPAKRPAGRPVSRGASTKSRRAR